MVERNLPKLDTREQYFRIPSRSSGLSLFLRYLPPLTAGCARHPR
jgi:hypothetical protein